MRAGVIDLVSLGFGNVAGTADAEVRWYIELKPVSPARF